MNPLEETLAAARVSAGPATRWMLALVLAIVVVVGVGSGIIYIGAKGQLDRAQNQPARIVPINSYVAGVHDVFACVSAGEAQCTTYASSVTALKSLSSNGFPITGPDGTTSTYRWGGQASAAQAAKAFTTGSTLDPSSVVTVSPDTGRYTALIGGKKQTVTISMSVGDRSARVTSIKVTAL